MNTVCNVALSLCVCCVSLPTTYLEHRARSQRASNNVGDSPRRCNISKLRLPPVRPLRFGIWMGLEKLVGPSHCRWRVGHAKVGKQCERNTRLT